MSEPLAERMRPRTLDDYVGQKHLVGEGAVLRKMIDAGRISSFILWGPPGVGKTTLAQIIANKLETPFYTLSAVTSGVKDVREVIERAKSGRFFSTASPILFIDEIHRFSKSQQDSLLGAVERGVVTLIGATTENPSFEVIRPLLSRCQLYVLKSLDKDDLLELLQRAITTDTELSKRHIELKQTDAMMRYSGGDARKLLNILELVVEADSNDHVVITDDIVASRLQQNPLAYDKGGDIGVARKPLSVGMKQNKEDFDRELKTYSTKALKNIITIAENSFDANTRLKANQYLLDKCYGKDYKAIVDETEQNTETKIMLQIVNPKQNMNIDKINNEIAELTDNDDNDPWGAEIYKP